MTTREAITQFLFIEDAAQPVDLTVVLGSKDPTTMDRAIELYKKGWTKMILVTGHGPDPDEANECELFCRYAIDHGVPNDALIREPDATNTKENFTLSAPIVEAECGWQDTKKVAIVCKPFHTRRALMTAQRQWPEGIEYILLPANSPEDIGPNDWHKEERWRRRIMAELRRIGEYAEKGDLQL